MDVNEFLSDFKVKKTEAHTKRLKTEKMRELIFKQRQHDVSTSSNPRPTRPPPTQPAVPGYPGGYAAPTRPPFSQHQQSRNYQNYQSYQWG